MRNFFVILLFFMCLQVYSQDSIIQAIYGKRLIQSLVDYEKQRNPESIADMEDRLKRNLENIEYQLFLTKTHSLFMLTDQLENNNNNNRGSINIGDEGQIIYIDYETNQKLCQKESFRQLFLISGSPRDKEWELVNETKIIGKFTCYRANTTRLVKNRAGTFKHPVTAWYTPEIPYPHGPNGYGGLPGLIVELEINRICFFLKAINPKLKENDKIEIPSKGKKVTEEEYNNLVEKSLENTSEDSFR